MPFVSVEFLENEGSFFLNGKWSLSTDPALKVWE
jgi:hypothetical protein